MNICLSDEKKKTLNINNMIHYRDSVVTLWRNGFSMLGIINEQLSIFVAVMRYALIRTSFVQYDGYVQ